MKIRISSGYFRGQFSDEFILENWNNEVNGSLVSEWELIEAELPNENFMKPKWEGSQWTEGASWQEITDRNKTLIDAISADYRGRISALVLPYLPDFVIDAIPIPSHVLTQRLALQAECDFLIKAIDPNQSMSRPAVKNQK